MRVQFLGTGDAFCSGGRFQTCFYLSAQGFNCLIDCGATSLLALKTNGINLEQIDGIVISHFHGDHFGGIPFFLLASRFQEKRTRPLYILGPEGVSDRVEALLGHLYPNTSLNDLSFEVRFMEFSQHGFVELGPLKIESFPVVHVPESNPHGIRILSEQKCLSFSGDTGWTDELYKIADQADLFICECNFYDTESESHLNYQKIKSELEKLRCKHIILNHLGPEMLENLGSLQLECSHDGLVIEV